MLIHFCKSIQILAKTRLLQIKKHILYMEATQAFVPVCSSQPEKRCNLQSFIKFGSVPIYTLCDNKLEKKTAKQTNC